MASHTVTDRRRSADRVVTAAEAHAPRVAAALAELALDFPTGCDLPDFETATLVLGRILAGVRDRMVDADLANEVELDDDAPAHAARDEAVRELRAELTALRAILYALYGSNFTNAVLVCGAPEDPAALCRFTTDVVHNLGHQVPPESRVAGARVEFAVTCARLTDLATALDTAVGQIRREQHGGQVAAAVRANAVSYFDLVFTGVATALEGLLELASLRSVASSIRPSRHRPGETASAGPDPDAPTLDVE